MKFRSQSIQIHLFQSEDVKIVNKVLVYIFIEVL